VTIYYSFHPLLGHSFPVVRVYNCHDEVHYVVRRADGRPLAVPAWMTRPEAAAATVVPAAHLPVSALLDLRRAVLACLPSGVHNVDHEDDISAPPNQIPTTKSVRGGTTRSPRRAFSGGATKRPAPSPRTVDASGDQDDPQGGRR